MGSVDTLMKQNQRRVLIIKDVKFAPCVRPSNAFKVKYHA